MKIFSNNVRTENTDKASLIEFLHVYVHSEITYV